MTKILYEINSKEELEELIRKVLGTALSNMYKAKDNQADELLTTKQACRWLKTSRTKLWQLQKKGVIPSVRFGNELRFSKSEILKSLKENNKHQIL